MSFFIPGDEQKRAQVNKLWEDMHQATTDHWATGPGDQGDLIAQTGEAACMAAQVNDIGLQIIKLPEAKKGFVLLLCRWAVKRSFGRLARSAGSSIGCSVHVACRRTGARCGGKLITRPNSHTATGHCRSSPASYHNIIASHSNKFRILQFTFPGNSQMPLEHHSIRTHRESTLPALIGYISITFRKINSQTRTGADPAVNRHFRNKQHIQQIPEILRNDFYIMT